MKLTVHTSDGAELNIEDFDPESVMEMIDALSDEDQPFLTLAMDSAMVYVNKAHVVRIDVD